MLHSIPGCKLDLVLPDFLWILDSIYCLSAKVRFFFLPVGFFFPMFLVKVLFLSSHKSKSVTVTAVFKGEHQSDNLFAGVSPLCSLVGSETEESFIRTELFSSESVLKH